MLAALAPATGLGQEFPALTLFSDPPRVEGRVVALDSSGGLTPLAGVPVRLDGEATGVVTGEDGRYAIVATGAARRHVVVTEG